MDKFDAENATSAYLAMLPSADQLRATSYTHAKEWLIVGGWVAAVVVAWLIIRSDALTALRRRIESRRERPFLTSFAVSIAYLTLSFVLGLPWSLFADWWIERQFGLTQQSMSGFLIDQVTLAPVEILLLSIVLVVIFGLIRRLPRRWPLLVGGVVAIFLGFGQLLQPVVIEPLVNQYREAPAGPVRDAVTTLGRVTGVPTDKIYIFNGSKQSNRYTANVAGIGPTARIAMSDVMFAKGADLSEVRAVLGHEMGHYAHQHVWIIAAAAGVFATLGAWCIKLAFPFAARRLSAHSLRGVSDPAALPVLGALIATVALFLTPAQNALTRLAEADADRFSLANAREPDGLAKALIKTAEYRAPSPSAIEELLFYDHPSVARRIRAAMLWKAVHQHASRQAP